MLKKCPHGQKPNNFCDKCSAVKMVILTKGDQENRTWYSFLKLNNKPWPVIINGMVSRFMASKGNISNVNRIQFYDNQTGNKLKEL